MPTLDWLNKAQALKTAAQVPYRLLEPQSVHGDPAAGNWLIQGDNLITQGRSNPVVETTQTGYGPRYTVKCNCPSPDGRNPCTFTVWQIDAESVCPRLITAYPVAQ